MNQELTTLFFAMSHSVEGLIETFNRAQLLSLYVDGCELKLQIQNCLDNFETFHKRSGIPLGKLISNKYHLAKQMYILSFTLKQLGVKNLIEQQHLILNN